MGIAFMVARAVLTQQINYSQPVSVPHGSEVQDARWIYVMGTARMEVKLCFQIYQHFQ